MKYISLCIAIGMLIMFAFDKPFTGMVTGKVTDESGSPIASATVNVKGASAATVTSFKGEFSINVPDEKSVLVFSAVGYQSAEVRVGTKKHITVVLKAVTAALKEVVVVGYGNAADKSAAYSPIQGRASGLLLAEAKEEDSYEKDEEYYADPSEKWRFNNDFNTEGYTHITENPFLKVNDNPLSTFSIDVDAASYSNMRRFINGGQLPPAGAVRIEEMINYFSYQYPQPQGNDPFSVNTEISSCPWNASHKLVLVGLQGKKIPVDNLPPSNLVFLVDVSGSMQEEDKLPLVQSALKLLVDQLREEDRVALVVYAGNAGLVLPSTSGANKMAIKQAIAGLEAGGSTAGGAGIQLAYKIAQENFSKDGNNRVILCTDGDFNVGASSDDALVSMIEEKRKTGIFLTVLGFGTGNYQDSKMQQLADKGNGNHGYIDGLSEAKKMLINEFGGTLFTIAKDVKLQIEFNPAKVQGYRLIGYENRMLAKEDFNNDKKDAGELGSGHTVTALYEIIPVGVKEDWPGGVDALKYQKTAPIKGYASNSNEIMNVKLRYKKPGEDVSVLMEYPLVDNQVNLAQTSQNFRFAASVAEFGMLLRNSQYSGSADFNKVEQLARQSVGEDKEGYRKEFLELVKHASRLAKEKELAIETGE